MSCGSARLTSGSSNERPDERTSDAAKAAAHPPGGGMSASPARIAIGQSYGASDTGRKRRPNEENLVCAPPLFAVADGMGGAQAGELASELAAAALRERTDREPGGEAQVDELIQEANRRVHQRALDDAA